MGDRSRAGQWVTGPWVERVTIKDGSYGSWVDVRWPVTHVRAISLVLEGYKDNYAVSLAYCAQTRGVRSN